MRDWKALTARAPLLAEAFVALAIASLLIAVARFRRVAALATHGKASRPWATPARAQEIDRAISAWARRVPWRAVCFQQGLAAQLMLRRRGLAASLYYGARRDDDGNLVAHVWVRSGEVDVTGCTDCDSYGVLASFPPTR